MICYANKQDKLLGFQWGQGAETWPYSPTKAAAELGPWKPWKPRVAEDTVRKPSLRSSGRPRRESGKLFAVSYDN